MELLLPLIKVSMLSGINELMIVGRLQRLRRLLLDGLRMPQITRSHIRKRSRHPMLVARCCHAQR